MPEVIQGLKSSRLVKTIPPGKVDTLEVEANFFYVLDSQAPLQILYDDSPFIDHDIGTGLQLPPGQTFKRLTIRNTSLITTTTVVLFVGLDNYIDHRLNLVRLAAGRYLPIMEGKTRMAVAPITSLAASGSGGDHLDLDGVTPADGGNILYSDIKRQSVVVTNLDPASNLVWSNGATPTDVVGGVIFPQRQVILPVSEFIRIKNPTGSAIACYITEIWTTALLAI